MQLFLLVSCHASLLIVHYDMSSAPCAAAENGFMGMGIGAAMTGLRPIVEGMNMGFLLLAFNQVSKPCACHEQQGQQGQQGHEHE